MEKQWISVNESLPKEKYLGQSDFVLTWDGSQYNTICYDYELKRWCSVLNGVTHWMPLPTPPSTGDKTQMR